MAGLVVTDIVSSFGAYINQGQNADKVKAAFMNPESSLLKVFRSIPTQNEVERSALVTQSRVAQAFKRKWSALGDTTFKPHSISLFKHKMDVEIYPDDVEKSWMAFLAGTGIKRSEWPIGRWLVEKMLLPKYDADIEMNERVSGIYAAPTDNTTPANAGTAMDGIIKILDNHITASQITPFATGALSATAATLVGQIEGFVKSIDHKVRKYISMVNVPLEIKDLFIEGMNAKYNVNWGQLQDGDLIKIRHSKIVVNFVEAQDNTDLIWATIDENAVRYVKRDNNRKQVEIQDLQRQVMIFTDHWEGLGFNVPEFVFCNDQPFA